MGLYLQRHCQCEHLKMRGNEGRLPDFLVPIGLDPRAIQLQTGAFQKKKKFIRRKNNNLEGNLDIEATVWVSTGHMA